MAGRSVSSSLTPDIYTRGMDYITALASRAPRLIPTPGDLLDYMADSIAYMSERPGKSARTSDILSALPDYIGGPVGALGTRASKLIVWTGYMAVWFSHIEGRCAELGEHSPSWPGSRDIWPIESAI